MQGTVISDVVNMAYRLEGLTKVFGAQILISETVFTCISSKSSYFYRYLGEIEVKGKTQNTKIWEILTGKDENTLKKLEQKTQLENAIHLFEKREFIHAKEIFLVLKEKNPNDKVFDFYLGKLAKSVSNKEF